ncbi:leucine-rich repeat protein [Perkinsela sp. CCAP 1560/4]|nr:leucine-rich repeat protein [Perkinsela sp. CCAP 1560/4]|eukprot:KNH07089.1 leucine-rich repeat protein [Perkinsela sp. CCAP 1560/4]
MHVLLLIASDTDADLLAYKKMQETLVNMLFDPYMQNALTENHPDLHICEWREIKIEQAIMYAECTDGVLHLLMLSRFFGWGKHISMQYVPPTVEIFELSHCGIHEEFNPRTLPREAFIVSLAWNRLRGTPRLSELPGNIEDLNLSNNRLHGPIFLDRLPRRIRRIDLSKNTITGKYVLYDNLPASLEIARIDGKAGALRPHRPKTGQADIDRICK